MTKDDSAADTDDATAGDDHIVGFMTGDTLDGGAGNDILEGADGADTYLFGRGYGQDVIREALANANLSEDDRLVFGAGISLPTSTSSAAATTSSSLSSGPRTRSRLKASSAIQLVHLVGHRSFRVRRRDQPDSTGRPAGRPDRNGRQRPYGRLPRRRHDRRQAGNDLLEGGDGGDTYLFGRGYGQDEIRETLGNANLSEYDTLRFGAGRRVERPSLR